MISRCGLRLPHARHRAWRARVRPGAAPSTATEPRTGGLEFPPEPSRVWTGKSRSASATRVAQIRFFRRGAQGYARARATARVGQFQLMGRMARTRSTAFSSRTFLGLPRDRGGGRRPGLQGLPGRARGPEAMSTPRGQNSPRRRGPGPGGGARRRARWGSRCGGIPAGGRRRSPFCLPDDGPGGRGTRSGRATRSPARHRRWPCATIPDPLRTASSGSCRLPAAR